MVDFSLRSGLNILAVGYTIYLGSEHEATMLHQAARIIYDAHQHGLITVLWIYPRGKAVADEKDPHLIAGATGVAACLGSDFVKVNYPKKEGYESKDADEKVAVSEWFCPGTLDNLQQNPLISFLFKHWEPMDLTTVNIIQHKAACPAMKIQGSRPKKPTFQASIHPSAPKRFFGIHSAQE